MSVDYIASIEAKAFSRNVIHQAKAILMRRNTSEDIQVDYPVAENAP
jgi:hypothetical protein